MTDPIAAVEDAIGADFYELAPPGEAHFDPVPVGEALACLILYAAGAGVKDAIQEAAKDGTAAILRVCGRRIRDRLTPDRFHEVFDWPHSREQQAAAPEQANESLANAATAAAGLDPAMVAQLAAAVAAAVADAAHTAGLQNSGTQRLAQTIEAQVKVTFTPVD